MQTLWLLWVLALLFTVRTASAGIYAKLTCHFPISCASRACERYPGMCQTDTATIVYSVPFMAEMLYDDRARVCRVDGDPGEIAWCRAQLRDLYPRTAAVLAAAAVLVWVSKFMSL